MSWTIQHEPNFAVVIVVTSSLYSRVRRTWFASTTRDGRKWRPMHQSPAAKVWTIPRPTGASCWSSLSRTIQTAAFQVFLICCCLVRVGLFVCPLFLDVFCGDSCSPLHDGAIEVGTLGSWLPSVVALPRIVSAGSQAQYVAGSGDGNGFLAKFTGLS